MHAMLLVRPGLSAMGRSVSGAGESSALAPGSGVQTERRSRALVHWIRLPNEQAVAMQVSMTLIQSVRATSYVTGARCHSC